MLSWECGIPGKPTGIWAEGTFRINLTFHDNYPATPPKCVFTPPIPHPNIYPSGAVCLSIIGGDWKPTISMKQILLGIQDLLDDPNPKSPANQDAYVLFKSNKKKYEENARSFAKLFKMDDGSDAVIAL